MTAEVYIPQIRPDLSLCAVDECDKRAAVPVRVTFKECGHYGPNDVCTGHAEAWGPVPQVYVGVAACVVCGAIGEMGVRLELEAR